MTEDEMAGWHHRLNGQTHVYMNSDNGVIIQFKLDIFVIFRDHDTMFQFILIWGIYFKYIYNRIK